MDVVATALAGGTTADDLGTLFEALREQGFAIGLDQCIAAERVSQFARVLAENGERVSIAAWLAPILCTSEEEQRRFEEVFERWAVRRGAVRPDESSAGPERNPEMELPPWWISRAPWLLSGALVAALIAVAAYLWFDRTPPSPPVLPAASKPAAEARPSTAESASSPATEIEPPPQPAAPSPERVAVLPPPRLLRGRVLDRLGLPVAGASVHRVPDVHTVPSLSGVAADKVQSRLTTSGKYLLLWGPSAAPEIVDLVTDGQPRRMLEAGDDLVYAEFDDAGTRVVTVSPTRGVLLFDPGSGDLVAGFEATADSVVSADFTSDAKRALKVYADGWLRVWDAKSGRSIAESRMGQGESARFGPDGETILVTSPSVPARLLRTSDLVQVAEAPAAEDGAKYSESKFSSNGSRIATASVAPGSPKARVHLLEGGTLRPIAELNHPVGVGDTPPAVHLSFSSESRALLAWSEGGTARLWNSLDGSERSAGVGNDGSLTTARFASDGASVVAASGSSRSIGRWSVSTGERIGAPIPVDAPPVEIALVANSDALVVAGPNATNAILRGHEGSVRSAAFSPDGKWVVTASDDATARVWDAETGRAVGEPMRHASAVYDAAFSSDGRRLATVGLEGGVRVWDAETHTALGEELRPHGDITMHAALSPDGKRLVTASGNGTARVWDAETGRAVGEPMWHSGAAVNHAAFSPDGKRVVTASLDMTARVWDTETGRALGEPMRHASAVHDAAFSSDGKRVVTASRDGTVRLWDAETGKARAEPLRHDAAVNHAAFSPDGNAIVTTSEDNTARVWDARTGKPLARLEGHEGPVTSAAFSPDGTAIVTASRDRTARIWDARTGKLRAFPIASVIELGDTRTDAAGRFVLPYAYPGPMKLELTAGSHELAFEADPPGGEVVALVPSSWLSALSAARIVLPVLPPVLLAAWLAWRAARRRLVLERRTTRIEGEPMRLGLVGREVRLFRGRGFRRALAELRRHREVESRDLDVPATIEEASRARGPVEPCFQGRKLLPEYLVLVDRASYGDQQARWLQELVAKLASEGPVVRAYAFQGSPDVCEPMTGRGRFERLSDLAARFGDHRLLIFSDGLRFVDPVVGGFGPWLGDALCFHDRVLLTPVNVGEWGSLEAAVARAGLPVLPSTEAGLLAFVALVERAAPCTSESAELRPALPRILDDRPWRWIDRAPPPEPDQAELVSDVCRYLGRDGTRWLAGCAVYPALEWGVTLQLGLSLLRDDGKPVLSEESLLRLVRLPWLRSGFMPDWLRVRLAGSLSREDERLVRDVFFDLLATPVVRPGSTTVLEIMRAASPQDRRRWWELIRERLRRSQRSERFHDAVFLDFLAGRRLGPLQLRVPGRLRELFFEHGLRAFGWRPRFVALAAVLASLAGLGAAMASARYLQAPFAGLPAITRLWDSRGGHRLAEIRLAQGGVRHVVPLEGHEGLALYADGRVFRYDPESIAPPAEVAIGGTTGGVRALVSNAGRIFAALSDGRILGWHDFWGPVESLSDITMPTPREPPLRLDPGGEITSLAAARSGDFLAALGPGRIRAWRILGPGEPTAQVAGAAAEFLVAEPLFDEAASGVTGGERVALVEDLLFLVSDAPLRVFALGEKVAAELPVAPPFVARHVLDAGKRALAVGEAGMLTFEVGKGIENAQAGRLEQTPEALSDFASMRSIVGTLPGALAGETGFVLFASDLLPSLRPAGWPSDRSFFATLGSPVPSRSAVVEDATALALSWPGFLLRNHSGDTIDYPGFEAGKQLATAHSDGVLRVWTVDRPDCLLADQRRNYIDSVRLGDCVALRLTDALAQLGANALALEPRLFDHVEPIVAAGDTTGTNPRFRALAALESSLPAIDRALAEAGLPAVLRYLPAAIAEGGPSATSAVGGIWRLPGARARALGLVVTPELDEREDAWLATTAVAREIVGVAQALPGEDLFLPMLVTLYGDEARTEIEAALASSPAGTACMDCLLPVLDAKRLPSDALALIADFLGGAVLAEAGMDPVGWEPVSREIPETYRADASVPGWGPPFGGPGAEGDMIAIPAGEFLMGCNETVDTECDDDEKPGRKVSVAAFSIDRTEVTVEAFAACVAAKACSEPSTGDSCNWGVRDREQHPVNCVDWSQAEAYCRWAGKRLPTEAEWEKAARGTDGRKYAWGNTGYEKGTKVANIADETARKEDPGWAVAEGYDDGYYGTAPVGTYPAGASPYGALDMIGNVWEWTGDWYKENEARAVRGGSWSYVPGYARASSRIRLGPGVRLGNLGFRCAQ